MKKIQIRNLTDDVFERMEQSAAVNERSLEGEARFALRRHYFPDAALPETSMRDRWRQETGARLAWLFDRLRDDEALGYREPVDTARIARLSGEASPATLLECLDGRDDLSFALADRLAAAFDADAGWMLSGRGTPFPVENIGNAYHAFFQPEGTTGRFEVELMRIAAGRSAGTLFCLRRDVETGHFRLGVVTEAFVLAPGMGGGGHGNLKSFLLFLKTRCGDMPLPAFDWTPAEDEEDFWGTFGQHHPQYFRQMTRRDPARWLTQMLQGEDPACWFKGWASDLEEIATA